MKISKYFRIILFILLITSTKAFAQKTYAVVVAISDYKNGTKRSGDLRYTVTDAKKFYDYLRSPKGGSVPSNRIRYLINDKATLSQIISSIDYIFSFAKKEDKVIFYFSGHGSKGYFLPYDFSNTIETILTHDKVKELFRKCQANTKLCIADACFSGTITINNKPKKIRSLTDKTEKGNIILIMSARPNEYSYESPQIMQGYFSYYLIKGLNGDADSNKDKKVDIKELFLFLNRNVSKDVFQYTKKTQHPIVYGSFDQNLTVSTY